MSRALILVNPTAGAGRAGRLITSGGLRLPASERWEVLMPESAEQARADLERELATGSVDRLIAVGGDGTAHLAANALLVSGTAAEVGFGILPAGSGSDFARSLGLPRKPQAALQKILHARPRWIDAIAVEVDSRERRYCLNIASAGLSGAVDAELARSSGRRSYLGATLLALLRYAPRPYRVWVDGEQRVDGPIFLVAMANGRFFGNGMKVAPDAAIDDGLLDVVMVPPVPRWQLPWRLPQFLTGRHVRLPWITAIRASEVRIEPEGESFPYDLDGEAVAAAGATFRILPGALRLLA
ncbi:MAG: diacylglycerol kinase family lipid kinase [Holophagales bacterium]|nr:diacylglycerol kinase family lipid kinase [Holophagales bacterium]